MLALGLVLMMLQDAQGMMAQAAARLSPERRCIHDPHSTDITVCGLRNADRFRVPFIINDPSDPRRQPVRVEREALLARTNPIQEKSPFLVGGGLAGVSATVGGDGSVHGATLRKPAP